MQDERFLRKVWNQYLLCDWSQGFQVAAEGLCLKGTDFYLKKKERKEGREKGRKDGRKERKERQEGRKEERANEIRQPYKQSYFIKNNSFVTNDSFK